MVTTKIFLESDEVLTLNEIYDISSSVGSLKEFCLKTINLNIEDIYSESYGMTYFCDFSSDGELFIQIDSIKAFPYEIIYNLIDKFQDVSCFVTTKNFEADTYYEIRIDGGMREDEEIKKGL